MAESPSLAVDTAALDATEAAPRLDLARLPWPAFAIIVLGVNLGVDIVYAYLDPRVRYA